MRKKKERLQKEAEEIAAENKRLAKLEAEAEEKKRLEEEAAKEEEEVKRKQAKEAVASANPTDAGSKKGSTSLRDLFVEANQSSNTSKSSVLKTVTLSEQDKKKKSREKMKLLAEQAKQKRLAKEKAEREEAEKLRQEKEEKARQLKINRIEAEQDKIVRNSPFRVKAEEEAKSKGINTPKDSGLSSDATTSDSEEESEDDERQAAWTRKENLKTSLYAQNQSQVPGIFGSVKNPDDAVMHGELFANVLCCYF